MGATARFVLLGLLLVALVVLCAKPLGHYIADVMEGRPNFALRWGARLERWIYRLCGIDAGEEMSWSRYAIGLLVFNLAGALVVYTLQRMQQWLPLNPQHLTAVSADSSFNTAVSFVTNTDWQSYAGESTMAYLTQTAGLTVQNFLSAATGLGVAIALIRGFTRRSSATIGNFWVDVTRSSLYLLLPLCALLAVALIGQGVMQNAHAYRDVATIEKLTFDNPKTDSEGKPFLDVKGNPVTESVTTQTQTLPMGPVASQEAIKELGTNGGGFFNANSAHPFENPTGLSNFIATLAIAGSLAAKKRIPVTEGTMPTHGALFISLLIGTIVLIGVLNYVPALALGPIVEHFMLSGAH